MHTSENWRPAPGYEGSYEISDQGNLRSVDRVSIDSQGRERALSGRIIHPGETSGGHLQCHLGRSHREYIHRLVLLAFVGPCPEGQEACHNDGNPKNNSLSNLRWDTRSENHRDRVRHGTHNETRKTECPMGHKLILSNARKNEAAIGRRACLACNRARSFAKYRGIPFTKELADAYYAGNTDGRRKEARSLERELYYLRETND